jgi:hypothetical protein
MKSSVVLPDRRGKALNHEGHEEHKEELGVTAEAYGYGTTRQNTALPLTL